MWEKNDIQKVLFTNEEIVKRSEELGEQITNEYGKEGRKPLVVALLKGSVPFLAELIKHIDLDIMMDFMDVSSYEGKESTGNIRILKDLDTDIKNVDVLLVEDIVDTGRTLATVIEMLKSRGASSVKVVSLLNKPCNRVNGCNPEFYGFEVGNEFVVGYGMDYDQKYRCLPYIGILKEDCYKK